MDKSNSQAFSFLYELLEGDPDKISLIVNMAVHSIERDLSGSFEAVENRDIKKAQDHLHKMKSNLAHLDLKEISSRIPNHKNEDFWFALPTYLEEVKANICNVKKLM
ncbi:hypothetical protein [Ekhidna sp.]|uniref:hypothetical protein n=2 Tax=Ekhidna sp. TaxID=2608089 RepID=UPI00329A2AF4